MAMVERRMQQRADGLQVTLFEEIISIGPSCIGAFYIDRLGLRQLSYPFDWLLFKDAAGGIELVSHLFRSEFSSFLEDFLTTDGGVANNHFSFLHDNPLKDPTKATRRIERLLSLVRDQTLQNPILFMYTLDIRGAREAPYPAEASLREQIQGFKAAVGIINPLLDFQLLVVVLTHKHQNKSFRFDLLEQEENVLLKSVVFDDCRQVHVAWGCADGWWQAMAGISAVWCAPYC
jgi:hypothetical protein